MSPIQIALFWSKVKTGQPFQCWEWQGAQNGHGYGRIQQDGRLVAAHRVAFELVKGPVPDGLFVLHSCDNRRCCNPAHLRAGTNADNMRDMVERMRSAHGTGNGRTKLTPEQVEEIRTNAGGLTGEALAKKFGVSESTISYVRNGRSWKYAEVVVDRARVELATPRV